MSSREWTALLERYADGRQLCNCSSAYYSTGVRYLRMWMGGSVWETENRPHCAYGCSANCIMAKDYIAKRVLAELEATSGVSRTPTHEGLDLPPSATQA